MIEINVNRVAEKMTAQTEKAVLNAYKESLDSMRLQMGKLYEKYSKNGSLTYAEMTKYNRLKSMQTSIQSNIGEVYKTLGTETRALAKKVYEESFFRYGWSIEQTMGVNLSYGLIDPKVIQASIENPIAGLTLKETLAKNRLNVVTNLKQNITQGLVLGESYDKMARRIKDTLDGDATKAMRVVRTEGHRNSNQGRLASIEHAQTKGVDVIMEWRAAFDDRTRDTHANMDGQRRKVGENFVSPSGAEGPAPGMLGRASEDINCRCTLRPIVNGWEPSVRKDMLNKQLIPYTTYTDWASAKGITVSKLLIPIKSDAIGLSSSFSTGIGIKDIGTSEILYPDEIAKVKRGSPMDPEKANNRNPNPNINMGGGYRENCQSCVVSYEARLRGYDVNALPYQKGTMTQRLAKQTNKAWIDPETGKAPKYIKSSRALSGEKFYKFADKTIQTGERYTVEASWAKGGSGHILTLFKENGKLKLYDPQIGAHYSGGEVLKYFEKFEYKKIKYWNKNEFIVPQLLRVDNKQFNLDVVNKVLKGAGK